MLFCFWKLFKYYKQVKNDNKHYVSSVYDVQFREKTLNFVYTLTITLGTIIYFRK